MVMHKLKFVSRWSVAFALILAVSPGPTLARPIPLIPADGFVHGTARIVDGDTIEVAHTKIRLEGIDAPEAGQMCQDAAGNSWECGTLATRELAAMTQGRTVDCHATSLDKYGRVLAICYVDKVDINAEMVARGYAWAFVKYSQIYVAQEATARQAKRGIWQGTAMPAWEYRAGQWASAQPQAPSGCAIKGNVSRSGLIYHMPWSPWYQKVAMSPGRGTRWFCTQAEAEAAGWRPAMTHYRRPSERRKPHHIRKPNPPSPSSMERGVASQMRQGT